MPRYHFNIYHDGNFQDQDGMELPDKRAAWVEATTSAGEMLKDLDGSFTPGHDWRVEVTDEFKNPLWEIQITGKKKY